MAPEDFAEEHRSDHQSDIWAVGVTLYEMLTGARPFNVPRVKDPFAWRRALLTEEPVPLASHREDIPEGLERVVARALARDKQDRYPSAGEFRDDLIAIQEQRDPAYARTVPQPRPSADATVLLTATEVGGPGVLVAEPPAVTERARPKLPSLLKPKEIRPARVEVDPPSLYFGELRQGEQRTARISVRIVDGDGRAGGVVAGGPAWASVSPPRFERRRQMLAVTALSDQVWQTGEFEEPLRLDTSAGPVQIPLAMRVLPARRRFSEVAIWFVPLFASVLLPALTMAVLSHAGSARYLVPSAALASGLLAVMLLLICQAADLGIEERIATGLVLAVMAVVLGAVAGVAQRSQNALALLPLVGTGVPIGCMLVFQLLTRRFWKLWSVAIVILSLLASGSFIAALSS